MAPKQNKKTAKSAKPALRLVSPTPSIPSPDRTPPPRSPTDAGQVNSRMVKRDLLITKHQRSIPNEQFRKQVEYAARLFFKQSDVAVAVKAIKDQWIEHGIWDSAWEETKLTEKRCLDSSSSTAASRPFNQFVAQLQVECRRIRDHVRGRSSVLSGDILHAIYTQAYTKLRSLWDSWGIWYRGWQIMPGTTWIHELPLEAWLKEEMGDEYIAHDKNAAPVRSCLLRRPVRGAPPGFAEFAKSPTTFGAADAAKAAKAVKQATKSTTKKKAKEQPKSAAPAKKAKTVKQSKKTPAARTPVQPSGGVSKSRRSPPPLRRSRRLQSPDE
ncbi:hypothetical protein BJY00DRAFT_315015 [Aspergillus carlsbadensis]|nr:hypothetical protein BJY00DRAFT_315015 [Aspergillus carlsbadensis]